MFNKIKEIVSKSGALHFRRWNIISTPWFNIYLHGIYKRDEELHLHNHPWTFISIVLKGWYSEKLEGGHLNVRYPGNFVKRKPDDFHKIDSIHSKSVYTLNFVWNKQNTWGYKVNGKFVDHETYRQWKNEGRFR